MRSNKTIHVISAHAEGEVGDVIVGGVSPPLLLLKIRAYVTLYLTSLGAGCFVMLIC
jgi:hypothetical protein